MTNRATKKGNATSGVYAAYRLSKRYEADPELPEGYELLIWRPSLFSIVPPTLTCRFAAWWLFHYLGIMSGPEYCVLLVHLNGKIVHRSCLVPKYFRWPFMGVSDLQISSTWTHADHRCHGLAKFALQYFAHFYGDRARTLWYIARPQNAASIAVCRSCHFDFAFPLCRTKRWGSLLLGSFRKASHPSSESSKHGLITKPEQTI